MASNLFIFIALVNLAICSVIGRCYIAIHGKDESRGRYILNMLLVLILYSFTNAIWEEMREGSIAVGSTVLVVTSLVVHLLTLVFSYFWYRYTLARFDCESSKLYATIELFPLFAGVALILIQCFTECLFSVSEDGLYISGPLRHAFFVIIQLYLVGAFARGFLVVYSKWDGNSVGRMLLILEALIYPIIGAIIQESIEFTPWLSVGYMLSFISIFVGSDVIDSSRNSKKEYADAINRAYEDKNAIYAEFLRMQSAGIVARDENDVIILANEMAMKMFLHTGENPEGMTFEHFGCHSTLVSAPRSQEKIEEVLSSGGELTYELMVEGGASERRYIRGDAKRQVLPDGSVVTLTSYVDITQTKTLENDLRSLSSRDPLTNIDNRGSGEAQIEELLNNDETGLFCIIDVDKFKLINDEYGHTVGDKVLIEVASALTRSFRSDDVIMRLGGDEFAIYAKSVSSVTLAQVRIDKLFELIDQITIPGMNKKITISLGALLVDKKNGHVEDDFSSIYKKADSVMYVSKERTGNSRTFA